MALSPRDAIVGVSTRADDADSHLRHLAKGLPQRRIDLEAILAARPEVVVRYWGGEPRLISALQGRGVRVVTVEESQDFAGIRANIRRVAAALGREVEGDRRIRLLDAQLSAASGAWRGATALYLTPGGVTAGPGTLVDSILRAAGLTNAETRPGFQTVSLEALALTPPGAVVLGFFDTFQLAGDSWGMGRHRVLQETVRKNAVASLPGAMLGCPNWAAAEAVALLAAQAPR
jgi:iron complex transport system substrate-binding protein